MMRFPLPLNIWILWHPRSIETCWPLAKAVYVALNRDPFQPLVPGIGIPVQFRFVGADPKSPFELPRPIPFGTAAHDLVIALLTSDLVLDEIWMAYLGRCQEEAAARGAAALFVPVALSSTAVGGTINAERLDRVEGDKTPVLVQRVLLQACRLLENRPRRTAEGASQSAAPLKLFLSHTKRDAFGLRVARSLKDYFDDLAVDRFFDEVSIAGGDQFREELVQAIRESAVVAIRTDGYAASPWCRLELAEAKAQQRPMSVVDALSSIEPRSSPFLGNLPSIRLDPERISIDQLLHVANFVALEALRFLHSAAQLKLLKQARIVPEDAILLARSPEARDLIRLANRRAASGAAHPMVVYPDPLLTSEEAVDYEGAQIPFRTPMTIGGHDFAGRSLGVSIGGGDSAEEASLGLSELHLEDAMRVVARQALAAGARVVYGGTLAAGSLTESLFEMIGAYNRAGTTNFQRLLNVTPWPWWREVDTDWLASRRTTLYVDRCGLPPDITDSDERVANLIDTPEGRYKVARSLTYARDLLVKASEARVVLGGKVTGFLGLYPGIVEEVLLSVAAGRPVFVLGGFGGAARVVAEALRGAKPPQLTRTYQEEASPSYRDMLQVHDCEQSAAPDRIPPVDYEAVVLSLQEFGVIGLAALNRLSPEENATLFETTNIDIALHLVMKGLGQLWAPT